MLVLDSDHMSLLEWPGQGSAALRERLADVAPEEVATTIISFEEQMRGWMSYIARAKPMAQQLEAYRRLRRHLENYRQVQVWTSTRPHLPSLKICAELEFASEQWT